MISEVDGEDSSNDEEGMREDCTATINEEIEIMEGIKAADIAFVQSMAS
jgi:hypothetical protein